MGTLRRLVIWAMAWLMVMTGLHLILPIPASAQMLPRLRKVTVGIQQIVVYPPPLFGPQDSVTVAWDELVPVKAYFRFGNTPGVYTRGAVAEQGETERVKFVAAQVGLNETGIYYGIITSSPDANIEANEYVSGEFPVIVEAQTTAEIVAPKGKITDPTPLFEWLPVDGVPYYHILLSDQPVEITEDEYGGTIVRGANIIWQAITAGRNIRYGEPDPSGYFVESSGTPPPLMKGMTYHYLVLNNYGNHPVYSSSIQSGVTEFIINSEVSLSPPVLNSPADAALLSDKNLTFRWDAVANAVSYKFSLFEERLESGSQINLLVYETTTTNTLLDFPAKDVLVNSRYLWKVLAWDESGGGAQSLTRSFNYKISIGTLQMRTQTSNGGELPRVEIKVQAISGSADILPLMTDDHGAITRQLRPGQYKLTARKDGYQDQVVEITLKEDTDPNSTAGDQSVIFTMTKSPSSLRGRALDGDGQPLGNVTIEVVHSTTGESKTIYTDNDGYFLFGLTDGTYELRAQKIGYVSPSPRNVTLAPGATVDWTGSPLVLIRNEGSLIVTANTINGAPLTGVIVTVENNENNLSRTTSSDGKVTVVLTSGDWTLTAKKDGYVSPQAQNLTVYRGGTTRADLVLQARANVISGFVGDSKRALSGATVTATPRSGNPVTATTNALGQYSLSLGSGTYSFTVVKDGYTPAADLQLTLDVGQTISGVDFTLVPNPSSVSGRVTSDGVNGIGGATVTDGTVSTTTTPSGAFALSLSEGAHNLYAFKSGYSTSLTTDLSLQPGQELAGINFELTPNAAAISGNVTSKGLAVAQAIVTATGPTGVFQTQTDGMGGYRLGLQPGTWGIQVTKNGFVASAIREVPANPGQNITAIDFSLTPNVATLRGVVTDGKQALRNAAITISDSAGVSFISTTSVDGSYVVELTAGKSYEIAASQEGHASSKISLPLLEPATTVVQDFTLQALPSTVMGKVTSLTGDPRPNATVSADSFQTLSKADGTYRLDLPAGTYQLKIEKPGFSSDTRTITLTNGQILENVDFAITGQAATLTGVVKSSGQGLANVLISLLDNSGKVVHTAMSNSQGHYTVTPIVSGAYRVKLEKSSYAGTDTTIAFSNNATIEASFNLKMLTGRIAGKVTSQGTPLAQVTVTATSTGVTKSVVTNEAGEYDLTGLPLLPHTVTVARSNYTSPAPAENVVPDRLDLDFVLTPNTGSISGRVLSGNNGVADVLVYARGAAGNAGSSTTGSDGSYNITSLAADSYRLSIERPGYTVLDTAVTVNVTPGSEVTQDLRITGNSLSISGAVFEGTTRQAQVPVVLGSASGELFTHTNSEGNFSFGSLPPYGQYRVQTKIFKPGVIDDDSTVTLGTSNVSDIALYIIRKDGEIFGEVGLPEVTITVRDTSGQTSTTTSLSTGQFTIKNLRSGIYRVRAGKLGYLVSPAELEVVLQPGEKKSANFTLTANMGRIAGTVLNSLNQGLAGATITAATAGLSSFTTVTEAQGNFILDKLPAEKIYTVTAQLAGWTSDPSQREVSVARDAEQQVSFRLLRKRSAITGVVKKTGGSTPLANVELTLLVKSTGNVLREQTKTDGSFGFFGLSSGQYVLTPVRSGFQALPNDTTLTVGIEDTVRIKYQMESQGGALAGSVKYRGATISDATITVREIVSAATETGKSGNNGNFTFENLAPGTYEMQIQKPGLRDIRIPNVPITKNRTLTLPVNLPAGRVTWRITNGQTPLVGVPLQVTGPSSQPYIVTQQGTEIFRGEMVSEAFAGNYSSNTAGIIESDSSLFAGDYFVSTQLAGYLTPQPEDLKFTLRENEQRTLDVPFVFTHKPLTEATSQKAIRFRVDVPSSIVPDSVRDVRVFVRPPGTEVETAYTMARDGNGYVYDLPPVGVSGKLKYRMSGTYRNGQAWRYTSDTYEVRVNSVGVLYVSYLSPGGGLLQKGEETEITVYAYDDAGYNLASAVDARGSVQWQVVGGDSVATFRTAPNTSRVIYLTSNIEGILTLIVRVEMDGVVRTRETSYNSRQMTFATVNMTVPPRLDNETPYQIQFRALSTDSLDMRVKLEWTVNPAFAGSISSTGLFTPRNDFLGAALIRVREPNSGFQREASIDMYARIDSTTQREFRTGTGLKFTVMARSVTRRKEISIDYPLVPEVKKFTKAFRVADRIYRLLPTSLTFEKPLQITLPVAREYQGQARLGIWNQTNLQWDPLPGQTNTDTSVTASSKVFGQFAVLIPNQPIGIHGLSFLPTPFSPKRGPMRVGYRLSTQEGQALVTIRIYNMSGELVRTIAERQPQYPGIHKERAIAWDGKTNTGEWARNGRYLVEIQAEDVDGKVRQMETVVLIK